MEKEQISPNGNFVVREDGLFAIGGGETEISISDPIWHLGNAVRADGSGACDVVEFLDRKGIRQEVIILHSDAVNHPRKVFDVLADWNFAVPELQRGRDQLLRNQITSILRNAADYRKKPTSLRIGWGGMVRRS